MKRLLTVVEFAERLGLQPCTIRAWINQRKLGVVRLGRAVRLREDEAEKLIKDNYRPAIK